MPYLETALYTYLTGVAELAALVGDRVYPFRVPQPASTPDLPAVSWRWVGAQRAYDHDPFGDTTAWVSARVQFDCWATTATEAIEVAEALIAALSGYEGDMGGVPMGSATVELELDQYEPDTKLYRRLVDVRFNYEEATTAS